MMNYRSRNSYLFLTAAIFAVMIGRALAQTPPPVPDDLRPSADLHVVLVGHATGEQIYTCKASSGDGQFAWTLSGPEATLTDSTGKEIAKHFAGPTWRSTDGSQVKAKMISQTSPDPDSIPWLLLVAVDHSGTGIMTDVRDIQRLNTRGGKAPATGCDTQHPGDTARVDYTADYYFYAPAR